MEDNEEYIRQRWVEASERFWDRKARFTYYLLSLPFALTGVAVSSFRPNDDVHVVFALIEVLAWLLLLSAGASGILAKWGEMHVARMESLMAQSKLSVQQEKRSLNDSSHKVWQGNSDKLRQAERAEDLGSKWVIRLLAIGGIIWILGRAGVVLTLMSTTAN
ncbi:hypothetical protein ACMDCT_02975 [Halomonadaceae bacterium KBTZ08]